jgi:hypothetical protein
MRGRGCAPARAAGLAGAIRWRDLVLSGPCFDFAQHESVKEARLRTELILSEVEG